MSKEIKNVTVDKISILSKEETPAVEGSTFRIFKFFKKDKFTKSEKQRLEVLLSNL